MVEFAVPIKMSWLDSVPIVTVAWTTTTKLCRLNIPVPFIPVKVCEPIVRLVPVTLKKMVPLF